MATNKTILPIINEFFEKCFKEGLTINEIISIKDWFDAALYSYMEVKLLDVFKKR